MRPALLGAALFLLAPSVRAEGDAVRACIAASTDGQGLRQKGQLLAAREQMIACARDACPSIVRSHCARWLGEIDAAIPSIVVRAEDASGRDVLGARLAIDGRPATLDGKPVRLDPGPHVVAVEVQGGSRKEEQVLVVEGEASRRVTIRMPDRPAASPPLAREPSVVRRHVPTGAWVLGAAGVVSLGVATYFGIAAGNDLRSLQTTCSPHCSQAATQPGRADAAAFDVLLGVGVAAIVGAVTWAVALPSRETTASAEVGVLLLPGGGMAQAGLRF
jgi:hypothetical protein